MGESVKLEKNKINFEKWKDLDRYYYIIYKFRTKFTKFMTTWGLTSKITGVEKRERRCKRIKKCFYKIKKIFLDKNK